MAKAGLASALELVLAFGKMLAVDIAVNGDELWLNGETVVPAVLDWNAEPKVG